MDFIGTLLRQQDKARRLKILSHSVHETFQGNLRDCVADFYCFQGQGTKRWNNKFRFPPRNHFIFNDEIPEWFSPDILLCQNLSHYQWYRTIQTRVYLPLITLEHCLPVGQSPDQIKEYKAFYEGDAHIFITDYNREAWGYSPEEATVIEHGIDLEVFKPDASKARQNVILTVANEYPSRDGVLNFQQYLRVTKGLPTRPVGDSPGFSLPAANLENLVDFYQTSRIFLNTAHVSPIPMSLLEAMACGCACVSCKTAAIPDYIMSGYNGLLCKNDKEMRGCLEDLLRDEKLASTLGRNARSTIVEKCDLTRFTRQWDEVLNKFR